MEFRWLEDYLALIECRSFSKAAELRAVSQPSFSRRIRALEAWVGVMLIDRNTHRLKLTPAGDRFRIVAEDLLRRFRLGCDEVSAIAKESSETLRFASTHVLSLTYFPFWLRSIEMNEPSSATVELTADHMVACERMMIEGRCQFLLCHHHETATTRLDTDFRSVQLGNDKLIPVMSPELSEKYNLETAPQLAFTAESGMGRILTTAWRAAGRKPQSRPVFTSHLASVLTTMARDSRGVAWTALSLVADDLEKGRLVHAGVMDDEVPIEIRLWRPKHRQQAAAESFWKKLTKGEKQM
jgi:DNA-binding transcriptional LysR family regulator